MMNPFDKNPVMGVLFTKGHDVSAHVHDLSPRHEERRMENLRRIFGGKEPQDRKRKRY